MSGFLNKKSASTNKWKKFWFGLRRPYLYFYTSENLENEKSIDLTNSAITLVNDEQVGVIENSLKFQDSVRFCHRDI